MVDFLDFPIVFPWHFHHQASPGTNALVKRASASNPHGHSISQRRPWWTLDMAWLGCYNYSSWGLETNNWGLPPCMAQVETIYISIWLRSSWSCSLFVSLSTVLEYGYDEKLWFASIFRMLNLEIFAWHMQAKTDAFEREYCIWMCASCCMGNNTSDMWGYSYNYIYIYIG